MDFQTAIEFIKIDESLGLVFGFAVVCLEKGEPYVDLQKDHIPEDAMLEASLDFMRNSRMSGDMHARDEAGQPIRDGEVVFAFPLTTEIAKSMGIQTERTGLMVAIKPSSDVLAKFKDGTYTGFSIGGDYVENEEVKL